MLSLRVAFILSDLLIDYVAVDIAICGDGIKGREGLANEDGHHPDHLNWVSLRSYIGLTAQT